MSSVAVSIIVAIITGCFSLAGVLVANKNTTSKILNDLDTQNQIQNLKIENLTMEVRKHNGFAERIPVIEEQQKEIWKRINKLEDK